MTIDGLMRHLDRLDNQERVAELIGHARTLPPAEADALVHAFATGDVHRRWLALKVVGSRPGWAWDALDDPSRAVRALAAKLVGRHADVIPATVLDRLDQATLAPLLRQVVSHQRTEIAEQLVAGLLDRERHHEAAYLLPTCSVDRITAYLDTVVWPETVWPRLARYRSELVCAVIERDFVEAERPDLIWRRHPPSLWARLCERKPDTVADWVDRFAEPDDLPGNLQRGGIEHLVRHSPARVVGWLSTRSAWLTRVGLPAGLAARLGAVPDDALAPLCRGLAEDSPTVLGQLLARLPHRRRARLFESAVAEMQTSLIEWPVTLLVVLPTWLRDREAARMLGLVRARTDGSWRRELLGLRSIGAARAELEREGRSSEAAHRGEAHSALVLASARSREGMTETLGWLRRIRNEQDPVRMLVLDALARVPGHQFTNPDALDAVVGPIFDARDTSFVTRDRAARIARALLVAYGTTPTSPLFRLGLSLLERLAGHEGTTGLPRLDQDLPRGSEQSIVTALQPWLAAAQSRQQDENVFAVWSALGERAWRVSALDALVERTIWSGRRENAARAAEMWLQNPITRDERVRRLVDRDRSALYLSGVFAHCVRRRQTLLAERFSDRAPRGRFHDGRVVHIPWVDGGFHRWPTGLQRKYVDLLRSAEAEPKHYAHVRAALVSTRARVPITTVTDLGGALASTDVTVAEAALGALAWIDTPAPALPILLANLDGDRARVAMYALSTLSRSIPRDRVVDALAQVLARPQIRTTVHKETLRLLGELATPRAMELLRETWQRPLHSDVRIAALHAVRSIPNQPDVWTMFAAAARDESEDVAGAVVGVSPDCLARPYRASYLRTMLTVADHPRPTARAALFDALTRGWWLADPAAAVTVGCRVIARLELLDPWRSAATVVAEGGRSPAMHGAIIALVEELATAAEREVEPAGERDRIAHQRLSGMLDTLMTDRHPTSLHLIAELGILLCAMPYWWPQGARLQVDATANTRLGLTLLELIAAAPTPRSVRVIEQAARIAASMRAREWAQDDAVRCSAALVEGPPAARIVAAALVAEFGSRWGWDQAWTDLLRRLREDPDLDVRASAGEVWMVRSG